MTPLLHPYDVTREEKIREPLDFADRAGLKDLDRCFRSEIVGIVPLTGHEKLFHVRISDAAERERFAFHPGQFVMVELPGFGEVPISIAGTGPDNSYIELCIRNAGNVTAMLHRAAPGAVIGLRGPFGSWYPIEKMKGESIIFIAGGLGIAPLRAPLAKVAASRADFGRVHVLYGAADPSQLLFDYQYDQWRRVDDVTLDIIVEQGAPGWTGRTGMVTDLLENPDLPLARSYAIVCGPPVMFKYVCARLSAKGMAMDRMFVSLERRMHCGMGKCCRCNVGSTYVCMDGPVFDFWTVMNLKESI